MKIKLKLQKYDIFVLTWLLFFTLIQFRTHIFEVETKLVIFLLLIFGIGTKQIIIYRKKLTHVRLFILRVFLVFLITCSTLVNNKTYLSHNLREISIPLLIIVYVSLFLSDTDGIDKFFECIIVPLNIYFLINAVILLLQIKGSDIFIDRTFYSELSYDYISGFFGGTDGAHRITFFTSLLSIINLTYFKCISKRKCILSLIFYLTGIIITIFCSTQNDNVSFFVLLPITILVFYMIKSKRLINFIKEHYKFIIFIMVMFLLLTFIMQKNPMFEKIWSRINNTVFSYGISKNTIGSLNDERALLFGIAISKGKLIGQGIGSIKLLNDPSITTRFGLHFGMASAQTLVYMTGIIGYFFYLITIAYDICRYHNRKIFNITVMFFYLFISSYYSQVLTVFNANIIFSFILLILGRNGIENK